MRAASAGAIAGVMTMAIASSVLSGQLFLMGVRALGISRTVVFIYLMPPLTAVLAKLVLDEPLTLSQAAGGAAVLAGVYWSSRAQV
jgi:drug/metabolite transporter (DMT)-like permease